MEKEDIIARAITFTLWIRRGVRPREPGYHHDHIHLSHLWLRLRRIIAFHDKSHV